MSAVETYFITWKGRRDGPYSLEQLTHLLERGEIGLLHRVETNAGLVPLRDLLPPPNPADFVKVKTEPTTSGLLGPLPLPAPVPPPIREPEIPVASPAALESLNPEQAARLYTICGLCFVFPPLAVWSWMMASELEYRGQNVTAVRMKWLSVGLAGGGVLLWILLWRLW